MLSMNKIKVQYILAVTILFGLSFYILSVTKDSSSRETYQEVPKEYLKLDRGVANQD